MSGEVRSRTFRFPNNGMMWRLIRPSSVPMVDAFLVSPRLPTSVPSLAALRYRTHSWRTVIALRSWEFGLRRDFPRRRSCRGAPLPFCGLVRLSGARGTRSSPGGSCHPRDTEPNSCVCPRQTPGGRRGQLVVPEEGVRPNGIAASTTFFVNLAFCVFSAIVILPTRVALRKPSGSARKHAEANSSDPHQAPLPSS